MSHLGDIRNFFVFLLLGQLLSTQAVSFKANAYTVEGDVMLSDWKSYTDSMYVGLNMPRFVEKGHSALLRCEFSVELKLLYKVEFRRNSKKVFQWIRGRRPPFRAFTFPGGSVDWNDSNETQVMLKDLDFPSVGMYHCTIAMTQPVYSRDSGIVDLTIFERQQDDPTIVVRKASYSIGEVLELNCTSQPARPTPAVSWLLNGNTVDYKLVKTFEHGQHQKDQHLSSSTAQLTLEVLEKHIGPSGFIELTCLSTIPAYLDDDDEQFADKRVQTISIEVFPLPTTTTEEPTGKSPSMNSRFHAEQFFRFALPAFSALLLG